MAVLLPGSESWTVTFTDMKLLSTNYSNTPNFYSYIYQSRMEDKISSNYITTKMFR